MILNTFNYENFLENEASRKYDISVYGDCVVKEYENHIRINKRDWIKFKRQIIAALETGDTKHATGNNETEKDSECDWRHYDLTKRGAPSPA
jgi:hypothetical protein